MHPVALIYDLVLAMFTVRVLVSAPLQYATPCFSFAAITLVVRPTLPPYHAGSRLLVWSRPPRGARRVGACVQPWFELLQRARARARACPLCAPLQANNYYNATYSAGLLADALLALDAALTALAFGQPQGNQGCAQGHCNFYTMPLSLAIKTVIANNLTTEAHIEKWESLFSSVVFSKSYNGPNGWTPGNWGLVAMTGEFARWTLGPKFGGNLTWVVGGLASQVRSPCHTRALRPRSLLLQRVPAGCPPTHPTHPPALQWVTNRWTDNGEYQDLSGCDGACSPMPYDVFPRKYMAVMLSLGYNADNTTEYYEQARRGALVSLLMQSPRGEVPTGKCRPPRVAVGVVVVGGGGVPPPLFLCFPSLFAASMREPSHGPPWLLSLSFPLPPSPRVRACTGPARRSL